ncbi:MAG: TonB C-terminal domain-containing protein [Proteobacteria bacterium]|nr:TonB C-terminal domain-containing protein [Pseudomonadota bacterium]HQR04830.1 energy transducer TonB [Rhodocyclaceae bacterium]
MSAGVLDRPEEPGKTASLILAVGMHLFLAALLIYGIRWQNAPPQTVEVDLVNAVVAPVPVPEATPPPPPEPRPEPRAEPRPEPKPVIKPDIALKEKPKSPPKEEPPKPVPSMTHQLNRELNRMQDRMAAASANARIQKMLDQQQAGIKANARDIYIARIRGKIRGLLVPPPGIPGNPVAVFDVSQLPGGEVLSVRLQQTSGYPILDAAIERAIRKASPLPKPDNPDLFERDLRLTFKPLED